VRRSPLSTITIKVIEMIIGPFTVPIDPFQIACPVIVADKSIYVRFIVRPQDVVQRIRCSSSLATGLGPILEPIGEWLSNIP